MSKSLIDWHWHSGKEGVEYVSHHVAKVHNRYYFDIKTASEPPNDLDLFPLEDWITKWFLSGFVIDNKWHTHKVGGKFDSLEDAMNTAESVLITLKLQGNL